MSHVETVSTFNRALLMQAFKDGFTKLNPRTLAKNPVIFLVEIGALYSAILWVIEWQQAGPHAGITGQIALWLWFTVLFANFAEAIAEGRGKAQANALRQTKSETPAKLLPNHGSRAVELVLPTTLQVGDWVLVEAGDIIPADGDVVEGIAMVDESAITGESAPVIRESGGDRSAVTGGTRIVSDSIVVEVSCGQGDSFLDRMICMVEGAKRQKTPNELALTVLLVGMTIIFLTVTLTLEAFARQAGTSIPVVFLIALLVALIPTTIGGLLSAIGIAGMDRLIKFNVIAKSGRAVEAAGDVDTLLLDKTGTITYGSRMAAEFIALPGVMEKELAEIAYLCSLADDTAEGKSIVKLAVDMFGFTETAAHGAFIEFSAKTRMSGLDIDGREIRKGAVDAVMRYAGEAAVAKVKKELDLAVHRVSSEGGTPLVVAEGERLLGVIYLKDTIKAGLRERFIQLRAMGIRTVMITGDNPLTAAAIAAEAGVDDFLAEATPENKLDLIRREQAKGKLVAMCGDGSNDAPALAQADVGIAMNTGTQAAREAGNMIDLDSNPTKLIEVVMIGKQLLMSRGALTTFSIANDVAKYFAIIPALFIPAYPQLAALNVMQLASPQSAILSAIIFNALIVIALIPLALKGVAYKPMDARKQLSRNLWVYGLGGVLVPFVAIKGIDLLITMVGLV